MDNAHIYSNTTITTATLKNIYEETQVRVPNQHILNILNTSSLRSEKFLNGKKKSLGDVRNQRFLNI